ncbi:MAG: peptide chain release factor 1 [Candidatus Margulisiibacteriota bacterium]
MLEKFQELALRLEDLERKMSDPEVISNNTKYQELARQHAELKPGVEKFHRHQKILTEIEDTQILLKDPDLKDMAHEELKRLKEESEQLDKELLHYLLPSDPNDKKNAIVEIRSGTGGGEAALFASDLYRMYGRYADLQGWKVEVLSENLTDLGGIKEIVFSISGSGVFSRLKYESGTHRVQRVPETEAQGRIHTSAATVAVLPEAEEVDVKIDTGDLRVDTYRAQGAGGQHVNKTSSAVRITHMPSGIVVSCQTERSQHQNRDKCMQMLRAKLWDAQVEAQRKTEADLRKKQVGSGDRSEKIRTYNFPQSRVTDHRINLTLHCLEDILSGSKLGQLIDALQTEDRLTQLQHAQSA